MKKYTKEIKKLKKDILQEFEKELADMHDEIREELPAKIIDAMHEEIEIAKNEEPKEAVIQVSEPDDVKTIPEKTSLFDHLFGDINFPFTEEPEEGNRDFENSQDMQDFQKYITRTNEE